MGAEEEEVDSVGGVEGEDINAVVPAVVFSGVLFLDAFPVFLLVGVKSHNPFDALFQGVELFITAAEAVDEAVFY